MQVASDMRTMLLSSGRNFAACTLGSSSSNGSSCGSGRLGPLSCNAAACVAWRRSPTIRRERNQQRTLVSAHVSSSSSSSSSISGSCLRERESRRRRRRRGDLQLATLHTGAAHLAWGAKPCSVHEAAGSFFTSLGKFLPAHAIKGTVSCNIARGMAGAAVQVRAFGSGEGKGGAEEEEGREVMLQHLLVKEEDLPLILELQKRVIQGEDLSDLAAEHSICPSKQSGGMLGWIARGRTVPEFDAAAFSASVGDLVRVKTKYGWHLLQVLAERSAPLLLQVSASEMAERVAAAEEGEVQLIDVREPSEVMVASVPGFLNLPLSQFGQWAPTITQQLMPERDTYVICHHGVRSMQAAQWLQSQGFVRLFNVSGGIDEYSRTVDPTVKRY